MINSPVSLLTLELAIGHSKCMHIFSSIVNCKDTYEHVPKRKISYSPNAFFNLWERTPRLYNGQNGWPPMCPSFGGSAIHIDSLLRFFGLRYLPVLFIYYLWFADPILAVVNVINDTSLATRWLTPASVLQQGVAAYFASVESECFTNEQKGQQQNFSIPSNGSSQVTAGRLGKLAKA